MSTSRGTLPRPSRSNSPIAVLGGGRGLGSVLCALREDRTPLAVIVSIGYEDECGGEPRQRITGASVEDLRRSLEALTDEEGPLLRAIRRPLTVERLGRHPLGNLLIASAAAAFDDYELASAWLGDQLGVAGVVLPATVEPVELQIEDGEEKPSSRSVAFPRLRFAEACVGSPDAAVAAIEHAQWVVLAPGSLYRSVLSTSSVPDLATALHGTPAPVLWIANLEPGSQETAGMSAIDHLLALRAHSIRVDIVLHDPSATLRFDPAELAVHGVRSVSRPLRSKRDPAVHDPQLLRSALRELGGSRPAGTARG